MKISIIIPVYNCEEYIEKCIESILNQKYKNFEIILINDGSTDNSLNLINEYKQNEPERIIVINQKNAGAGAARNKGIEIASGDYLTFIDSDDYIKNDFLSTLLNYINGEDIIVSGYKKTDSNYNVLFSKEPENNYWSLFKYTTNWANLYKVSFIRENNIRFLDFRIGEDINFSFQCIVYLKTYKIVNYSGYYYFTNEKSITKTIKKVQKVSSLSKLLKSLNSIALKANYFDYKSMYYYFLKTSIFNLYMQRKDLSVKILKKTFLDEYSQINTMESIKNYKKGFVFEKSEELYINIILNAFIFAEKSHTLSILLFLLKLL